MKKIITIIFCLLASATMMGQECLTFMGVPTKGYAYYIISNLEMKGFKTVQTRKYDLNGEPDIIMQGMFCGELCDINMYRDKDWKVTSFEVTTHEHNSISKERAKKMYKFFMTKCYKCRNIPSLAFRGLHGDSRRIETTVVNKTGEPIGIVTFKCIQSQVHINFQNIEKKKKTFHKCDEHCDGYWMEELVSVK